MVKTTSPIASSTRNAAFRRCTSRAIGIVSSAATAISPSSQGFYTQTSG
jgi:hypothetical protein